MYTHVLLITLLTPCSMSDQYISPNNECTHIFTDNTPYTMLYVSSLFWYLILNERLARLAIYQSVSQFKNRGNKWHTICFATILLLYKFDILPLKQNKQPVLEITHFFLRTAAFTWVVRLKKNPVMSNADRFFYLNSTVFFGGYMMIIVPPYSDMGHILYDVKIMD